MFEKLSDFCCVSFPILLTLEIKKNEYSKSKSVASLSATATLRLCEWRFHQTNIARKREQKKTKMGIEVIDISKKSGGSAAMKKCGNINTEDTNSNIISITAKPLLSLNLSQSISLQPHPYTSLFSKYDFVMYLYLCRR